MIIDDNAMITMQRRITLLQIFERVSKSTMYRVDLNYYYENLSGDYPEDWTHGTWEDVCEYYANKWYGD